MNFRFREYCLPFLILIICAFGCAKQKNIVGSYNLVQSTAAVSKVDEFEQSILDADNEQIEEVITLFEDKKYTIINNVNGYSQGNWIYTERLKNIVLSPDFLDDEKKVATIDLIKQPYFITIQDDNSNQKSTYSQSPYKDSTVESHPFYSSNNQWRLKPKQAETDEQIKDRLAMYLKHLALVLKSSIINKSDVVSFKYSMGPVAIYSGGIGVIPFDNVKPSWVNIFFDETDARKAYFFYKTAIEESSISGGSTGEWVADDYRILLAIYGTLKKKG